MNTSARSTSRDIVVVTGADERYAMPLAVTIRSTIDCLDAGRRMRLFVLDGGLTSESKTRLEKSWIDPRLDLQWLSPDIELIRDLPVSHHISGAAYLRLLMPSLLPEDVTRVVYLDADMIVRRDLGLLWDEPQDGHAVLAVQDMAAPVFDASVALRNYQQCRRHITVPVPIANYVELGLPPDAKYFNSGMLVVDLAQWRRERYAEQVLDCLRRHRQHVMWWDQYALNVILSGKWRALDRRWNQGAHIYVYPNWRESPFDRDEFARLRQSPWIIHFCSPDKPWHYFCRHPHADEFYRCLSRTAWRGWRPARPNDFAKAWWAFHYKPLRLRWKTRLRIVRQNLRPTRRAG